jgi:hypothetical protein
MSIQPKAIRLKDAPGYFGVNINFFNQYIRPHLTERSYGKRVILFSRDECDAFFDRMPISNGRPGKAMEGGQLWDAKQHRDFSKEETCGTSKKPSMEQELDKVLEQVISRKRKNT